MGAPIAAPPTPNMVTIDENASVRWCQALATTTCDRAARPARTVTWYSHSLINTDKTAQLSAAGTIVTVGNGSPLKTGTSMSTTWYAQAPPAAISRPDTPRVPSVSKRPYPYGWRESAGLRESFTVASVTTSLTVSEMLCAASAMSDDDPL